MYNAFYATIGRIGGGRRQRSHFGRSSFRQKKIRHGKRAKRGRVRRHPATEPYKIFGFPIQGLKAEYTYTYSRFARAATGKPMYVASVIQFERADVGRIEVGKLHPHTPARLEAPGRADYIHWLTGLFYRDKAIWEKLVEDRVEARLIMLEKGMALNGDDLNRRMDRQDDRLQQPSI